MFRLLTLFLLFKLVISLESVVDINNLIGFGNEYNDKILEGEENGLTDPISFSVRYPFFNNYYDQIRISKNGLIIFGNNSSYQSFNTPLEFPIEDFVCVAPYWIDTNIPNDLINKIYYREIFVKNEANTLYQITKIIRNGFPKLAGQGMIWAFLVTWYDIPFSKDNRMRNTYQTILTTNGYYSFSLFNYHQLQWSQGLSDVHAQVGFNGGDLINYYKFQKSFSSSIMNIVNESNIGIPGQFVFHTSGNVSDVQCETSTGLQISPFRGSIYGGYEIRLHGICFNQSNYEIHIDNQIIDDCRVLNSLYIVCTMPMLMDSGLIQIELFNKENQSLIDSTDFLAHVPEDNGELILKNYGNLTNQIADPNNDELILQFQSNTITRKYLFRIIVYDYATQLSSDNQTLYNHSKQRIDLGLGYLNLSELGNLTIRYNNIFPVGTEPDNRVHALQISFEIKPHRDWLHSAFFLGAKIFTAAASLNSAYCPAWLLMQHDPNEYIEQVPVCPCQVPIEPWLDEYMGFRVDDGCDGRKPIEETCAYHKSARGCYRKKSDTTWAGAQCCYDEQGKFIEHGKEGAGTLDLVSPDANSWFQKSLSMFGHFFSDFLSYWSCCRSLLISEAMCRAYYNYRPAGKCENIENESIEKHGNTHFVTFNGISFDFHGQGEYTLLSVPKLNQLEIQIRHSTNNDYTKTNDSTIGIVAFVISFLNGKKRVQFELFPTHQLLEIRINSRLIDLPAEEFNLSILIYEDQHVKIKRKMNGAFKISFPGSPLRLRVHIRPTFDFFHIETLLEREKFIKLSTPSYGLLGNVNALTFPNGTQLLSDQINQNILFEYGESWKIATNNSFFYYLYEDIPQKRLFTLSDYTFNQLKLNINQQNCNDATYNSEQESCTQTISNTENHLLEQTHTHHLYHNDQHHLESLTVTIEPSLIPQIKTDSASNCKYSYTSLLVLCLYSLFIYIFT